MSVTNPETTDVVSATNPLKVEDKTVELLKETGEDVEQSNNDEESDELFAGTEIKVVPVLNDTGAEEKLDGAANYVQKRSEDERSQGQLVETGDTHNKVKEIPTEDNNSLILKRKERTEPAELKRSQSDTELDRFINSDELGYSFKPRVGYKSVLK
jgi:hypothetical protein